MERKKKKVSEVREMSREKIKFGDRIAERPLLIWDYVIFAILALFCFLVFQQNDLLHTAGCSYGYLNGHILDFYDYCAEFGIHPSYMPSTYILFAIWNIPMRILGIVKAPTEELPVIAILWAKLLPCIIYVLSALVIYNICMAVGMGSKKSKLCTYAALTTPVAFYAQFIFGQYDIFMTVCVLMGVYCYLKRKDLYFVLWFGAAMTFKYSALLIFVPLLLYRCKNIWKILAAIVVMLVPFAIEYLLYRSSPTFSAYVFGLGQGAGDNPTGYILNAGYFTGFELSAIKYNVSFAVIAFGLICAWAYFNRAADDRCFAINTFYLSCLVFFVLFGLAKWHPQWLLFAVPFWVISSFMTRDTKIYMVLDLIFMAVYIIFNVQMVPNNVDQAMFNNGILSSIVGGNIGTELMMKDIIGKLDPELCLSVLTMMMLVYAVFKHEKYCSLQLSADVDCMGWIRARFVGGAAIFIIPAFMCLAAFFSSPDPGYNVSTTEAATVLNELGDCVSQTFCSTGTSLDKLQYIVGVNGRVNEGYIKLTITDSDDTVLYEEDWETSDWVDADVISADLGGIPSKIDEYYTATLEVTQADAGYSIAIFRADENITGDSKEIAMDDGRKENYQYSMVVYQGR